jgi:thymidylate kinase
LVKKYPRFHKIDGNKKEEEVFEDIKKIIDKYL